MADRTREQIINDFMEGSNMTRPQAEAAAAIELGEIEGDTLEIEAEGKPDDSRAKN